MNCTYYLPLLHHLSFALLYIICAFICYGTLTFLFVTTTLHVPQRVSFLNFKIQASHLSAASFIQTPATHTFTTMNSISWLREVLIRVLTTPKPEHDEQELFEQLMIQKPRLLKLLDVGPRNPQEQREVESGK